MHAFAFLTQNYAYPRKTFLEQYISSRCCYLVWIIHVLCMYFIWYLSLLCFIIWYCQFYVNLCLVKLCIQVDMKATCHLVVASTGNYAWMDGWTLDNLNLPMLLTSYQSVMTVKLLSLLYLILASDIMRTLMRHYGFSLASNSLSPSSFSTP